MMHKTPDMTWTDWRQWVLSYRQVEYDPLNYWYALGYYSGFLGKTVFRPLDRATYDRAFSQGFEDGIADAN